MQEFEEFKNDFEKFLTTRVPNLNLHGEFLAQLSSLDVMSLILMIEEQYKIHFHTMDYDSNTLKNINVFSEFLWKKIKAET
ncbi:MAG: hypothetical protein AB7O96_17495 [Pseudobdellovibrionaceae bacterium]